MTGRQSSRPMFRLAHQHLVRPASIRFRGYVKSHKEAYIPLNWFENAFLAAGSAAASLLDPKRGGRPRKTCLFVWGAHDVFTDMVAALGETTAGSSLSHLRDVMLQSAEGRRILKQRPCVNTNTVDMEALAKLPEGTFGRSYVTWLERCGVTPDTREPVSAAFMFALLIQHTRHRYTTSKIQN